MKNTVTKFGILILILFIITFNNRIYAVNDNVIISWKQTSLNKKIITDKEELENIESNDNFYIEWKKLIRVEVYVTYDQ